MTALASGAATAPEADGTLLVHCLSEDEPVPASWTSVTDQREQARAAAAVPALADGDDAAVQDTSTPDDGAFAQLAAE